MYKLIGSFVLLFVVTNSFAADIEILHLNDWAIPKQSSTVLAMPAIQKSMQEIQANPNSVLKVKYPGGDEGTLWANELRSWLVTLGLSSKRIELVPGSTIHTAIELEIIFN